MSLTTTEYLGDSTTIAPSTAIDTDSYTFSTLLDNAAELLGGAEQGPHHHHQHSQITFEIPSHHDLEHINNLHKFNTLLQRIGNVAYDTVASHPHPHEQLATPLAIDATGHAITSEQISKSAVLNLADLKNSASDSVLERFFDGADMHVIINYLWIGVVTSLIVLSVIFIVFSCYFYRKFREWKKCNKDIRSHLNNDMYPGGTIVHCDSLMANGQTTDAASAAAAAAAYYQMESPPCYTIATGLPTYDEALHHHQHFSFGMKFVYPTIAAVHHHPAIAGSTAIISNWAKDDFTLKCSAVEQQQQQQQQQQQKKLSKMAALEAPPSYDAAASVALLSVNEKADAFSICMEHCDAMAPVATTMSCNKMEEDASTCSDVFIA